MYRNNDIHDGTTALAVYSEIARVSNTMADSGNIAFP
jgi:hypothetical protein